MTHEAVLRIKNAYSRDIAGTFPLRPGFCSGKSRFKNLQPPPIVRINDVGVGKINPILAYNPHISMQIEELGEIRCSRLVYDFVICVAFAGRSNRKSM